jgi:hypothetical protein
MTTIAEHDTDPDLFVDRVRRARLTPFESQHVFRVLLDALARPGRIAAFDPSLGDRVPPALLGLLALADVDVSISVTGGEGDPSGTAALAWEDVARRRVRRSGDTAPSGGDHQCAHCAAAIGHRADGIRHRAGS